MPLDLLELQKILWILLPLLALYLSLIIIGLWDWNKKKNILGQNKILWLLIILFFSMVGPIIYLVYSQRLTTYSNEDSDDWGI